MMPPRQRGRQVDDDVAVRSGAGGCGLDWCRGALHAHEAGPLVDDRIDRGEPRRLQDPIYALLRREVQVVGEELEALP